ncbi:MAG: response regulator [Thermodesulfobacteriota bacterium]|nr:response regulator [Thermodesulfobacteriota bacterium]
MDKMRILIVDDTDDSRYMLQVLLEGNGYTVATAKNGAEALEQLNVGPFDLIISDILMPVMDGFALCRKIKQNETLRYIPFLIYTATYTGPEDEAFAAKIGADRFIRKPCEPDELLKIIREVTAAGSDSTGYTGPGNIPAPEPAEDADIFKLYSERLVRKLEQKMAQLEKEGEARQKAEAALRKSEDKFKYIFENSPIGKSITYPSGQIQVNNAFLHMLGYTRDEFKKLKWQDITYPDDIAVSQEKIDTALTGEKECLRFIKRYLHKNGTVVWAEVSTALRRNNDGDPLYFITTVNDITRRKIAEAEKEKLLTQLVQSQKMESIGRLAGGVAHDFNNMLEVIAGYAELSMESVNRDDPLYAHLQEILSAARKSTDITRQLLAFARKQTIAPRFLDMNKTISGMLAMLRRLIGEEIDLEWIPAEGPLTIKIDPVQVDQILANLCVNARDAIRGNGRIIIETGRKTFDDDYCAHHPGCLPGDYVQLSVSDDGCGMDNTTLDNIFEPFFSTKSAGKGTGLGLATVYGCVKQNGGFINVYSEPDNGTTFSIYLPWHTDTETGDRTILSPAMKVPRSRGETVMVVENEPVVLRLVTTILQNLGYNILFAVNPLEAMAIGESHEGPIHLLISDMAMPDMNGQELARHVKKRYPDIKILFMSGYTDKVIDRRGVLNEGVHFIQKPFYQKDLAFKIREALDSAGG